MSSSSYPTRRNDYSSSSKSNVLHLSNLDRNVTEREIQDFLHSLELRPQKTKLLTDKSGNSKCSSFVQLSSEYEAHEAIKRLNSQQFYGRRMVVEMAN